MNDQELREFYYDQIHMEGMEPYEASTDEQKKRLADSYSFAGWKLNKAWAAFWQPIVDWAGKLFNVLRK